MGFMLGKKPAKIEPPFNPTTKTGKRLMIENYLDAQSLPTVADSCDWSGGIVSPGMHWNDRIGCCVLAMNANAVQSMTKCSGGVERSVPDDYILTAYEMLSGYVPGNESTDTGLVIVDVLNWWRANTFNGSILDAFADPVLSSGDASEFKISIQVFGGVMVGVQLKQGDMDAFASGRVWAPGSNDGAVIGGHAIWACAFNSQGPVFQTWNKDQQATWEWLFSRQDELHTPLMADWLNKDGNSPAGVDVVALRRDLQLVTA